MYLCTYKKENHYEKQKNIKNGICIDPILRENFDKTPHEHRDPKELKDWSLRPYVVTKKTPEVKYQVRCIDGAELDGSSLIGEFEKLDDAILLAKMQPNDYFELSNYFEQARHSG